MRQQYHDNVHTQRVIAPVDGWEAHTWYLVDVEVFEGNPRHRSLFHVGFLCKDAGSTQELPGSYSGLQSLNDAGMEDYIRLDRVKYLRVVKRLFSEKEMQAKEPVILEKDTRALLAKVSDHFAGIDDNTALWWCGCGHRNGANLAVCAMCGRTPAGEHP